MLSDFRLVANLQIPPKPLCLFFKINYSFDIHLNNQQMTNSHVSIVSFNLSVCLMVFIALFVD